MIIASVLSILLSSALAPATPPSSIVVTGRAIQDKKAALAACLARSCPPNEDIDASLALAETQLVAGKYSDARRSLLAALGRNKKEAMAYPVPVSDLYRANGRVAAHLGIDTDYYRSTWGIYNTLKKGVPGAKDLQYSAMMEVAEMVATTRGHDRAREYYRSIAYHARHDGRPDIAALAELRMILRHFPAYARPEAIREIAESTDPKTRAAQLEARLALARIAFEHNDLRAADAQVSEISKLGLKRPVLVYSPPWEVGGGPTNPDSAPTLLDRRDVLPTNAGEPESHGRAAVKILPNGPHGFASYRMPLNVKDMWIDVGFRITDQGTVADLQTLRSKGDIGWAKPLLTSIAGRRYTPAKAGSADSVRTERYTYTSGLEAGTGSHSTQHSPNARVEYFDLSDIAAAN
jgi:tetratricopeptide (TPR) repeat protein